MELPGGHAMAQLLTLRMAARVERGDMSNGAPPAPVPRGAARDLAVVLDKRPRQKTFQPRQVIFAEGDPTGDCYIIQAGTAKATRKLDNGRQILIALLGPGEIFGELAVLDPFPRSATVTTLTPLDAVIINSDALRARIGEQPEIAEQLLQVVARRIRRTSDATSSTIFHDVPARVARHLLDLARRFGTDDGHCLRVNHHLSQQEFAQLVGVARETVVRVLSDFTRRGWIRWQTTMVFIDDSDSLARRAKLPHPNPLHPPQPVSTVEHLSWLAPLLS